MKRLSLVPQGWAWFFIVLPLFYVVILSLQSRGTYGGVEWVWTFKNYQKVFEEASLLILLRTLSMAFITALICAILGGAVASFIAQGSETRKTFWLVIFLVPFFINSLIRLYSLQSFLGINGPVQFALHFLNPDFDGTTWSHNTYIMYVGLVMTYLPFAILPLVAAYEKWDTSLTEASWDLGASSAQTFWWIKWPLLKSAYVSSFFIVLIPCLGEFLAPEILEGAKNIYWGQYITEAYLKWRHWPLGSALGVMLLVFIILTLLIGLRVQRWLQNSKA